jgi:hypothetical protein
MVEQGVLRGGARRAVALGFGGGRSVAVGHREGSEGPIKGEAGDLGVRALVKIAAVIRAGKPDRATDLA